MSKVIKFSKEHGLNPTQSVCFFCDKTKGIYFLGKLKSDAKAPKRMLLDYEPCDECAEKFKQGILWIEAAASPIVENQAPIAKGAYPTGRWAVTKEDVLDRLAKANSAGAKQFIDTVREKRKAVIDIPLFNAITGGK